MCRAVYLRAPDQRGTAEEVLSPGSVMPFTSKVRCAAWRLLEIKHDYSVITPPVL
jgi:hypothetical protein